MKTTTQGAYTPAFDGFKRDYNSGKANGLLHHVLSPRWKAENERKCASGRSDPTQRSTWAYWTGYFDGMEIATPTPTGESETGTRGFLAPARAFTD